MVAMTTTPAGWYQDPQDPSLQRYWDGSTWTQHTAPAATVVASPELATGPNSALHYIVPVGRSWQSVAAPYLGLFSLVPIPVLSALVGGGAITLGVVALRNAKKGGHGSGRAIVAIVLGVIGAAVSIAFTVGLAL